MHEFEKVVLINTDVQIMQSGVDRLFDFPLKTFDIAMAPNGGTEDLCTVDWQEGVSHAGYSNSGVLVLRPSNSLYHMTDMFTRCIDYDQPLDEQLVLNRAVQLVTSTPMLRQLWRFHCLPAVFNCLQGSTRPCVDRHWPEVYIRHFTGDRKPLLHGIDSLRHSLMYNQSLFQHNSAKRFRQYLAAYDQSVQWRI